MTIELPGGLKELLAPRLKSNATGFQRAHVTGRATWNDDIKWLSKLGFGPDSDFNLTPLPEGQRGSATLGVAAHLGNNVDAFDELFYEYDPDKPDVARNSEKFLNRLEIQYEAAVDAARDLGGTQGEVDRRIADVNRNYCIRVMNFTDFIKTAFLYQEQLGKLGYNDLKSLGLNSADPRFSDAATTREYLKQTDVVRMFDYDFIVCYQYFKDI